MPYFPKLLGRFLIGYWAGRTRLFQDADRHLSLFRRVAAWGVAIGLLLSSLRPALRILSRHNLITLADSFWQCIAPLSEMGGMLLACWYAAVVVLLMRRSMGRRVLELFAPAGQMALSTYLGALEGSPLRFATLTMGFSPSDK